MTEVRDIRRNGSSREVHSAPEENSFPSAMILGDFQLEKEIASGASGVVWRAWDRRLEREVAIKIMRETAQACPQAKARFRVEAAATAALVHPHIVRLYGAGEEDGVLFLAMEYVEGTDLARITTVSTLPAKTAARYIAEAADGVHCAHESGVIHRDLKPSNLLLGADQRIRVADFGIARRESGDLLTMTGDTLGTPGYMAPEQAAGKPATSLSDIYGLGATLYHLLTGRTPFAGENHLVMLHQMASGDPISLRALNPGVPRDLETVCLKALAYEPSRRYSTSQELAEDLRRFLSGESVFARPTSTIGRVWRWGRRRPALASALAGVVILILAMVITSVSSAARIEGLRKEAVIRLYASDMRLAFQGLAEGRLGLAESLLERHLPDKSGEDHRGFEWFHLQEMCSVGREINLTGMSGPVNIVRISNDGRWLAAGGDSVCLWILSEGKLHAKVEASARVNSLSFSSDGAYLAVAHVDGTLRIVSTATGETAAFANCSLPNPVVTWEKAGNSLALMAGNIRWQWFWRDGQAGLIRRQDFPMSATRPVFSDDASMLAFTSPPVWDISLIDLRKSDGVYTIPGANDIASSLAFTDNGNALAIGHFSGVISIFESPFLQPLRQTQTHRGKASLVTFSRDNMQLASASNEVIVVQTFGDRRPRQTFLGHRHTVRSIAFSPDGQNLISGDAGGVVKVWRLSDQSKQSYANVISQDGTTILRRAGTRAYIVERVGRLTKNFILPGDFPDVGEPVVRAVWREGMILGGENSVCIEFDSRVEDHSLPKGCRVDSCSADGRWVYLTFPPLNTPIIWDRRNGRQHLALEPDPPNPAAVTFSPDSRYCASGSRSGIVTIYDLQTAREVQRLEAHSAWAYQRAFSQDGGHLATAGFDGVIRTWDWRRGIRLREFTSTSVSDGFWSVAFSPDGRRLAGGTGESTVVIWDLETGLETALLQGPLPTQTIEILRFTSDGESLFVHGLNLPAPRSTSIK